MSAADTHWDDSDAFTLLVEDDERVASSFIRALSRRFLLRHASTLAHARPLASLSTCAAIVLDAGMPDGSGLELLREVRATGRATPTIVLTGREDPEISRAAARLEALYAAKPYGASDLGAFIERSLGRRHARRRLLAEIVAQLCAQHGLTTTEAIVLREHVVGVDAGGHGSPESARSYATVKKHVSRILAKSGAPSMGALVERVLRAALGAKHS